MRDEDVLADLRRQAEQARKHAAFFSWYDRSPNGKGIAETGVVGTLLEAMAALGVNDYRNPQPSGQPWPDCWAEAQDGTLTPFEVSELVDQAALPAGPPRPWPIQQVRERVQAIISRKDLRSQTGRGSRAVVLVIHTDEVYLDPDSVSRALATEQFQLPHANLARAFLLFSYDPKRGTYPFLELPLAA